MIAEMANVKTESRTAQSITSVGTSEVPHDPNLTSPVLSLSHKSSLIKMTVAGRLRIWIHVFCPSLLLAQQKFIRKDSCCLNQQNYIFLSLVRVTIQCICYLTQQFFMLSMAESCILEEETTKGSPSGTLRIKG